MVAEREAREEREERRRGEEWRQGGAVGVSQKGEGRGEEGRGGERGP